MMIIIIMSIIMKKPMVRSLWWPTDRSHYCTSTKQACYDDQDDQDDHDDNHDDNCDDYDNDHNDHDGDNDNDHNDDNDDVDADKKDHSKEMEIAGWKRKELPSEWFVATKKCLPSPKQQNTNILKHQNTR